MFLDDEQKRKLRMPCTLPDGRLTAIIVSQEIADFLATTDRDVLTNIDNIDTIVVLVPDSNNCVTH